MKRLLLVLLISILMGHAYSQAVDTERDAFVRAQNEYLSALELDFYQNKQYQIITRNFDKQVMKIQVANLPQGVKNKRIKKLKKEKDKQMKSLLSNRQYKLYVRRQKVIEKTLSDDW